MPTGPNNRKLLELNSPGTSTTMGGDDYDRLVYWFENTDLTTGVFAGTPMKATVNTPTEFRDNKLRLLNPAQTKSLRIRIPAITNDYDLSVPLIDASDTFLFIDHDAEIFNKTINVNLNPIISTGISSGDILKSNGVRFLPMARGLPGQVLTVKDDGLDLEWADPEAIVPPPSPPGSPPPPPSGPIVPDDNTVTTTKIVDSAVTAPKIASGAVTTIKIPDNAITTAKILDANVTNAKLAGSITGSKLVAGTITSTQIASSTITNANLAGEITDDKLLGITNIVKLPSMIRYDWRTQKPGSYTLTTTNGADGIWTGHIAFTGNHSTLIQTSSGIRCRWTTGSTSGNQAGVRCDINHTRRNNNPQLYARFTHPSALVSARMFIGFCSVTAGFMSGADPLNGQSGIGVWYDTANTNARIARNDGTGVGVYTDLSPTTSIASAGTHDIIITCDDVAGSWTVSFNGTGNTFTTDIPATGTDLTMQAYTETTSAAAKSFDIRHLFFLGNPA